MQEVWKPVSDAGVYFVEIDQCETGAVLPSRGDDGKEELIRSHSGFLTNSEIAQMETDAHREEETGSPMRWRSGFTSTKTQ